MYMLENLNKYLPSESFRKKVLIIVGVLVVGTLGWYGYKTIPWNKLSNIVKKTEIPQNTSKPVLVSTLTENDQDGDGIPDWEERFWGTDPTKFDTNGDGISDGIEIEDKKKTDGVAPSNKPLNETEVLAQEFGKTALSVGQAGQISEEGANALSETMWQNIQNIDIGQLYTEKDIKISTVETQEAYKTYFSKVNTVLTQYDTDKDTSVYRVKKAIDDNNPEILKSLDEYINQYKKAVKILLTIPAPRSLASIHLGVVNSYARTINMEIGVQSLFENPAKAMALFQKAPEEMIEIDRGFFDFKNKESELIK